METSAGAVIVMITLYNFRFISGSSNHRSETIFRCAIQTPQDDDVQCVSREALIPGSGINKLKFRSSLPPLPQEGEGWGEGIKSYGLDSNHPHPNLLP